jgi:RNA polymerase sigma-70 factor (ECF subfamily)
MRDLPEKVRRALALHYLLDRSIADIATETGASPNTVKSWLHRGRSLLAAALDDSVTTAKEGARRAR